MPYHGKSSEQLLCEDMVRYIHIYTCQTPYAVNSCWGLDGLHHISLLLLKAERPTDGTDSREAVGGLISSSVEVSSLSIWVLNQK